MSLNRWGESKGLLGGATSFTWPLMTAYGVQPATSTVWATANRAFFAPVTLEAMTVIAQFWCLNGATADGNVDIGIYTADGTRLSSSGSTAQSGTSAAQKFNVTDLVVGPGLYYLALVSSSGTATFGMTSAPNLQANRVIGCLEQATALPLPATATFETCSMVIAPSFGFIGTAV